MPLRLKVRAALIGVACATCLAGPVLSAHGAETGVNVAPTSGDYFTSPSVHAAIANLHPAWVRLFMGWNAMEPARGVYNTARLADYHAFLNHLPAGTRVILDLEGTPAWAAGGSSNVATPPADNQSFAGFANYVANAFRGKVSAYEIGDEEDTSTYWTGTPAQYAALLKAAYPAVKSADPAASVILGGLAGNDYQFLSEVYAAGARGSFDAVAVHTDDACDVTAPSVFAFEPGTRTINRWYFLGFTSVHATMTANGDGSKPILMTEFGWSSTTAECASGHWAGQKAQGVSQATQASFLAQAYHCLAQPQYSYVEAALWFQLYDIGAGTAAADNYGLLNTQMAPKPAYDAFLGVSQHGDTLTGACGAPAASKPTVIKPQAPHTAGPRLDVLSPRAGQRYHGTLLVRVVAIARSTAIAFIELHVGHRHILNFRGGAAIARGEIRWYGAARLSRGRHTITLIARAVNGTQTSRTVSVFHR